MSVVQQFVFWLIINSHISPPPPSIPPKLMAVAKPVICGLENIKQNAKLKHALYQSFKKKKKRIALSSVTPADLWKLLHGSSSKVGLWRKTPKL